MFKPDQYQLVDFGYGKKLERFAGIDVLRPCPAAEGIRPLDPAAFNAETCLSYCREQKEWHCNDQARADWSICHGDVSFGIKPTPFGHLGVFCEQAVNWTWLDSIGSDLAGARAINLFAYTGGTTLKLASLGASVVHVDAAKTVVNWGKDNAVRSGLSDRPIRWIVDDAMTFVQREIKRGNKYDIIVADPPAFGHGGKRASWKIDRDLENLIRGLAEITAVNPKAILMTWHSMGINAAQLCGAIEDGFGLTIGAARNIGRMDLVSIDGRKLNCGYFYRWHRDSSG